MELPLTILTPSKLRLIFTCVVGIQIDVQARYSVISKLEKVAETSAPEFCSRPMTYRTFCHVKYLQRSLLITVRLIRDFKTVKSREVSLFLRTTKKHKRPGKSFCAFLFRLAYTLTRSKTKRNRHRLPVPWNRHRGSEGLGPIRQRFR